MKVLHINTNDISGGAARAAYRLHGGLLGQDIESEMLVQRKESNDPTVSTPYKTNLGKIYARLRPKFNSIIQKLQKTDNPIIHSSNVLPSGLHKKINRSDADIVHLHWVNGEMISIKEISKIKKPLVWTLHDMWAFSGSEHYDYLDNPQRYKNGYHKHNRPDSYKGVDIDRWTWNRKVKYWQNKKINIVTCSNWLAKCARESKLFDNKNIQAIPNGLDLTIYKPVKTEWARSILNIPKGDNKKYILFGAMSATSDKRKGFEQLKKALSYIDDKNYKLLIFGSEGYENISFNLPTTYLGRLNDDETLALAYSAADVMVVPSLQDNLPNTAVEATACGTPVAAFSIGGLPDIINHKENGYLAEAYDPEDLAAGIKWVVDDRDRNRKLGNRARVKAEKQFDVKEVAKQYFELYKTVR